MSIVSCPICKVSASNHSDNGASKLKQSGGTGIPFDISIANTVCFMYFLIKFVWFIYF